MHRLARKRQMALGHLSFNEVQYRSIDAVVAEVDGMDVVLVRDEIHEIENFPFLATSSTFYIPIRYDSSARNTEDL